MPTERFERISPEKKDKILKAAFRELSEQSYSEASINSIVREAEISRGSFYTYFESKADLLIWMLTRYAADFEKSVIDSMDRCGGDLFEAAGLLYRTCLAQLKAGGSLGFLKHTVCDQELMRELAPDPFREEGTGFQREIREMFRRIYEKLDRETYPVSEEEFGVLFPLLIMLVIRRAAIAAEFPEKEKDLGGPFELQIRLLKYGALRRPEEQN